MWFHILTKVLIVPDPSIGLCHINEMSKYLLVSVPCLAWYLMQWYQHVHQVNNSHAFLVLLNNLRRDIFFSHSPFHTIFPTPQLAQLQQSLMQVSHTIINPLHSHYSRIAVTAVTHSASAIFHEIFFCIKNNLTNGLIELYQQHAFLSI